MTRRNDLMTALLDTRRALEAQTTALGERVDASRREITDAVATQVSDLHADNRETRNRVNNAAASLSEINKSLPSLRQDISDLAETVDTLRTAVSELFAHLTDSSIAAPVPASSDGQAPSQSPHEAGDADTGPDGATDAIRTVVTASDPAAAEACAPEDAEQRKTAAEEVAATLAEAGGDPTDAAPEPTSSASERDSNSVGDSLARHDNVLGSAATVGTVHLVCHRDLWDFIQEHAADISHFRAPASPCEEGQDRLRIVLSGRSVIGVLIAMRETQTKNAKYGEDDGTWALSGAVYSRLAHDLTTTSRNDTEPLTVVFDDGINAGTELPS
ncbi:hypothetical protein ACH4D3_38200 [Streptomyces sp. NPDC018026]|uniref:hypothetical protein n=1 Tax=Streptomyces sp. NPDC018026 TaxID=3365031 RepID=UPI00379D40C5